MPKKILIIDDDDAIRDIVARVLAKTSINIIGFPDGESAKAHFDREGADLVIIDLILHGKGGSELIEEFRSAKKPPYVIILSALADVWSSRNKVPEGVVVFTKPVPMDALRKVVYEKLDIFEVTREESNRVLIR